MVVVDEGGVGIDEPVLVLLPMVHGQRVIDILVITVGYHNRRSKMWNVYFISHISGKTGFEFNELLYL
ncbi:hypothetical protein DGG96_14510 [Legionella qingyii]|uniref:Uncharacterized protein n=1 Tax=Legionella qingyii TaxID=2184757 RepID=A0A317TZF6_9GAMM|nr:hypothetical protein DGG96_14510 [Legionella qingyii]